MTELADEVAAVLRAAGCVYAEDEARLVVERAAGDGALLERLVARRCAGEPFELVVGFVEFDGLRVAVRPGVFVPRQRTAGLVEPAHRRLASLRRPSVVVDLGCGAGAMLAALLHRLVRHPYPIEAYALDSEAVAVECAAENLAGTVGVALRSNYFDALPERLHGRVDVVLANLPYVPTASIEHMPREARLYEPLSALDGGHDGLAPLRHALADAGRWLAPAGAYLCELGTGQLDAARHLAQSYGLAFEGSRQPEDDGVLVRLSGPS